MADESSEMTSDSSTTAESSLTSDELVALIHSKFSSQYKKQISLEDVARVVHQFPLNETRPSQAIPSLRVVRLRIKGEKQLHNLPPESFIYDQVFSTGVNVIYIPNNEVGKSSILKTIKYGLTGDDGDYDTDVRSWIREISLGFMLDQQEFTTLITGQGSEARGLLIPGLDFRSFDEVAPNTKLALIDACGSAAIQDELKRFFFRRMGLESLPWTQEISASGGTVATNSTSWLTYFQALYVQDVGSRYLLLDQQHAFGNQEGLIFSAFLGLHLVGPLNQLGVESQIAKKEAKLEDQQIAERAAAASRQIETLNLELQGHIEKLREFETSLRARRRAVEGGEPSHRLIAVQSELAEKAHEITQLEAFRLELNQLIQKSRAQARLLEEAIDFQLHFTGIDVQICPNCDTSVDEASLALEQTDHICRLCGTHAHPADPDQVAARELQIGGLKQYIEDNVVLRDRLTAQIGSLRNRRETLSSEEGDLRKAAAQGLTYALPTEEEQETQNEHREHIGRIRALIAIEESRVGARSDTEILASDLHVRILEKAREVLRSEAVRRNQAILLRLTSLIQEMTTRIGAISISDVTCTPLGVVQLKKHGSLVRFGAIQNDGERLRVKLSFFLAVMLLGQEKGLGRHPGLLLIDQPGSSEMVTKDAQELASIFQNIDTNYGNDIQIICCTARTEFESASAPEKIYGPQNPPYAF